MDAKTNLPDSLQSPHASGSGACASRRFRPHDEIAEVFKKTPEIADLNPGGRYVVTDLVETDAIPQPIKAHSDRVVRPVSKPLISLSRIVFACACFTLAPAFAFDGTRTPSDVKPAVPQVSPREAFVSGAQSLRAGEKEKGLSALQYAAEQGHALAQWKLGRMYAAGDGVPRSDLRAFNYFSRIADDHADESPNMPQARFVANAFVQLGHYYMKGIPDSDVKVDKDRAREMYAYAASYFGDPDAQYSLARIYLDGVGTTRDPRQAVRWLSLSANKGQARAQAVLGNVLFKGDAAPRQAALGLMWLTLARDNAAPEDAWIAEMHDAAFKRASDDERQLALVFLERWLKKSRD